MSIKSLKDINDAFESGRSHMQRFTKSASTTGDLQWIDWAFASGQPAYDARIGTGLSFNPYIASKNDAIFMPEIPSGMDRHLVNVEMSTQANGAGQTICSFYMYDLLGVYPLIDGDSTDEQILDNSLTIPRYTDGVGIRAVLVNHVAPMISQSSGVISYTDSNDIDISVSFNMLLTGQNKVVTAMGDGSFGGLTLPLGNNSYGVKKINSITFTSAPGGLYSIYIIKTILTLNNNDGSSQNNKIWTEKSLASHNAWNFPRIYDGAHLGFFLMPNGSSRTVSIFGNLTFVWG